MSKTVKLTLFVLVILILDQWLKIWVKTDFHYLEERAIFGLSWARLYFIENEGMAFGLQLGGSWGKLLLSLFRIVAIGFIIALIRSLLKSKEPFGLILCFGAILAGAIGNMIDSAFYGLIFSDSVHSPHLATMFPEGGGYGTFLHGKVVDMFHFPMIQTTWPAWVPGVGGERLEFFRPIFNLADSAISCGVAGLVLFYWSYFFTSSKKIKEVEKKALDHSIDS